MKILVTGGAGFIGSALVRFLINETSEEVVNLDKLTYAGNLDSLEEVAGSPRYHFEKADICARESLDRIFATYRPDAVIHLAAESHVDRSIDGPGDFIQTNLVGTYSMLEAGRAYWSGLSPSNALGSASCMSPPTKSTAISPAAMTCFAKTPPTIQARRMRRPRPVPTTWSGPGAAPSGFRCW